MTSSFDVIIIGAGMAGWSLAIALLEERLTDLSVLMVDRLPAGAMSNKTWCYWNVKPTSFDHLARDRYSKWRVSLDDKTILARSSSYAYLRLQSTDFFLYCQSRMSEFRQFEYLEADISPAAFDAGKLVLGGRELTARYIFDSSGMSLRTDANSTASIHQQFVGWEVSLPRQSEFNSASTITLMDFQKDPLGLVDFVYVLPFARDNTCLVEYTTLAADHVGADQIENRLRHYLSARGFHDCTLTRSEQGRIPMSVATVRPSLFPGIYPIGTAGGAVRGASGYGFFFIQRHSRKLARWVRLGLDLKLVPPVFSEQTRFLDSVFLKVLRKHPEKFPEIFLELFRKVEAKRLVRFLMDECSPTDYAAVVSTMPYRGLFIRESLLCATNSALEFGAADNLKILASLQSSHQETTVARRDGGL